MNLGINYGCVVDDFFIFKVVVNFVKSIGVKYIKVFDVDKEVICVFDNMGISLIICVFN